MNTPHVQVILDQDSVPGPLRTALNRVKARVSLRSMDKALASGISPSADVCVILPGSRAESDVLGRILEDADERACATLVIPPSTDFAGERLSNDSTLRRLTPPAGDDPVTMNADELTGRIKALYEIRSPLRRMRAELTRLRRQSQPAAASRHLDEQLRLAGEIQRDLLPGELPDTGPFSIRALFLPADFISGDIYDLARLDEDHFALSVADATGHGLPAALLTIFIKNSLKGKDIADGAYRIVEPDQLLARLNSEILATNLSQCQFITCLHAVFDKHTREIRWARGGVPYPILLRPGQAPQRLISQGGLIGAFDSQFFEVAFHRFEPGDGMLFFTDGLEALLARVDPAFVSNPAESTWLKLLGERGPEPALEEIRRMAAEMPDDAWSRDDITALHLSMDSESPR